MRNSNNPIQTVSREKLIELMNKATVLADVFRYFGLRNHGYNSKKLTKRLAAEGLLHLKDKFKDNFSSYRPDNLRYQLSDILVENSTYNRCHLKKRLLKAGLLLDKCYICGMLPIWNGKKLVMILDHINGVFNDNRIENLRFICPNCNSQTDTFAGKNKKCCLVV